MEENRISTLIQKYYAAFMAKDRKTMEAALSDDFKFTSPRDDHIDKAAYFEHCFPNSELIKTQKIEQVFVEGRSAFVRYLAELKDGSKFHNTEFVRFKGDQIQAVDVYFGANE
jgi:ketosteroid isomerase-like protein